MKKKYCVEKKGYENKKIKVSKKEITGLIFTPKNKIPYEGITVNKVTLVDEQFIKKIVKKKSKKIDQYLNLMILYLNNNEDDGTTYHHILNETTRFKDIIKYRYGKYLEQKYKQLMLQKIDVLQRELLGKMMIINHEKEHSTRKR